MFPEHIAQVLDHYGVSGDIKAALYELYVSMGDDVLGVFADIADEGLLIADLRREETETIRARVIERYVRRNHPRWLAGQPTPSLWHPREMEGRASGAVFPLGDAEPLTRRVLGAERGPAGIVVHGRNAHYSGILDTVSFDVVLHDVEEALALALAAGRQHTTPGSIGGTTATVSQEMRVALIWEVQPNVYKPGVERNRAINALWRRQRNWHVVTLASALEWLRERDFAVYVLRGEALAATHEADPARGMSADIATYHNRTIARVAEAFGLALAEPSADDEFSLLAANVMNHALRQLVLRDGSANAIWRVA